MAYLVDISRHTVYETQNTGGWGGKGGNIEAKAAPVRVAEYGTSYVVLDIQYCVA